uniref:N-acetyltransferase domain-containing protein n=1 Tax=Panagrolaimus sp. ES5 TaxID=591445 RepID=A0AC34F4D5_9BILA
MRPNEKFNKLLIVDPNSAPQHNNYNQPLGDPVPNWKAVPVPSSESLIGKYCRLDVLEKHHKNDLSKILNDKSTTSQYWRSYHGNFQKEDVVQNDAIEQFLFKTPTDLEFPSRIVFVIKSSSDSSIKGVAEFRNILPIFGDMGISVICSTKDSEDIGQEAGILLIERAISLGYRRCEWRCNAQDEYSVDMALKLGLRFECVLRSSRVRNNHNVDEVLLAITDKEWRQKMEKSPEKLSSKLESDKEEFKARLNELKIAAPEVDENGLRLSFPVPNWSPRPSPKEGLLKGRLCRLELLEHRHAEDLYNVYHQSADDRDWTYLFASRPTSVEGFKEWFDQMNTVKNRVSVAIVCNETNKAVGTAAFLRIDPENGVLEIGIASYRYGFTFEGILRQDVVIKGRNYDVCMFSIIDKEWPKINEAISSWLAPKNFDQDGKQVKRLDEYMKDI